MQSMAIKHNFFDLKGLHFATVFQFCGSLVALCFTTLRVQPELLLGCFPCVFWR